MANFYESKPMQWVKKAGEKVVGNKGIQAISSGMMMVMGVILIGSGIPITGSHITDDRYYRSEFRDL